MERGRWSSSKGLGALPAEPSLGLKPLPLVKDAAEKEQESTFHIFRFQANQNNNLKRIFN